MSRMKLHQSVRLGAYEIYPIYELNFTELKELTGYTLVESSDDVSPNANKFRHWSLINNDIPSHTDYFPRRATEDGNILPCDTRYNNLIDGRYYMPETTTESFIEVEQSDVQPEDWGVNPNYVVLNNITQSFNNSPSGGYGDVNVCVPEPVNIYDTWDNSTSYYEDTKRFLVRKFFLEDGKSFSVSKAGYYNSDRWRGISFGNGTLTSFRSGINGYDSRYVGYYFTRSDGTVINKDYRAERSYGITGVASNTDYDWPTWQNGKNITQFFVHYFDETAQTDFYGIAMAQMDNFLETASPIALDIVAFDAQWWGASIIAGGGGSGQWTTDGPISYVRGGRGSFQAPSDNRGDRDGTEVLNITSDWGAHYNILGGSGYSKYVLGFDSSAGIDDTAAVQEFFTSLWQPTLFESFRNFLFSPLESILACHFIPKKFSPPFNSTNKDQIVAAQVELTTHTVSKFQDLVKSYHVGSVDIEPYSDSFADYTNTALYIHLPYIGTKQLDINACMGGWLSVDYTVDLLTGDCIAFITTCDAIGNKQIRYTFKGNCAKELPVKQVSNKIISSMLIGGGLAATGIAAKALTTTVVGIGGAMTTPLKEGASFGWTLKETLGQASEFLPENLGSAIGMTAAKGAAAGIATGAINGVLAGSQLTSSNAEGGVCTAPIDTNCYLTIQRPQWSAPTNYGRQFGYPSDIGGTINQSDTEGGDPFTNFLAVRSIILSGLNCTAEEKTEIEQLMTAGVYVSND